VPLSEKDKVIDELETVLESKFLRYCNPVIPLHILAKGVVNVVCSKMRLTTRHPRRYPDRGISMPQEDKKELFDICLPPLTWVNLPLHTPTLSYLREG